MPNTLSYFTVTGAWRDVEQPLVSSGATAPLVSDVSAYVDFFPGTQTQALTGGLSLLVSDYETYGATELSIAPITGRTINALLCSIATGDPQGVQLVSDAAWMSFGEPLFYHVRYRNVTYGGALQRLSNFAFQAPTGTTPVVLTDPTLTRYTYRGP